MYRIPKARHDYAPGFFIPPIVSYGRDLFEKLRIISYDQHVELPKNYAKKLAKRAKESHIHRDYQFTGIEIANILEDPAHKALYIKLVKDGDAERLLTIAKGIAQKRGVKNKGAYFMRILQMEREERAARSRKKLGSNKEI